MERLGECLSRFRLDRNLTQADLAAEAGVHKNAVFRLEAGRSRQRKNLVRVLRVLGLLGRRDALVPELVPCPLCQLGAMERRRKRAVYIGQMTSSHQELGSYRLISSRLYNSPVDSPSDETASLNIGRQADPGLLDLRGTIIGGRYKVLGVLGEGGFGIVYEAEQQRPMRRRVALKVLKPGMDSKSVLARFEAERQALAVMDHANIARVLDGGATEQGHPYFVMELVRGEPITAFCDSHRFSIRERVGLLCSVCDAVQHAHSKGVIHRDIKPSNILVEYEAGKATPKVIDFGVAKAIDQRLSEHTIFTERGQLIGTPEYMSPEQAEMSGLDIDTRTDVYSLGVVLYELLTGFTPFDSVSLRKAAFNEIQRIIREVEPPKPSTRLSSIRPTGDGEVLGPKIAAARRMREQDLASSLRRDLDWIVLKSLDKDRERRYATPEALRDDLQHYLNDEPVDAGPPTRSYQLRKFVTRNRGAVIAAGVVVSVLVLGIIGTSLGMAWALREQLRADEEAAAAIESQRNESEQRRIAEEASAEALARAEEAERERQLARRALAESERAATILIELFGSTDPYNDSRRTITLPALLREMEGEFSSLLASDSIAAARVAFAIGSAFFNVGESQLAVQYLTDARDRFQRLGVTEPSILVTLYSHLATSLGRLDREDEAIASAKAGVQATAGPEVPIYLKRLAADQYLHAIRGSDREDEIKAAELRLAELSCLEMAQECDDRAVDAETLAGDIREGVLDSVEIWSRYVAIYSDCRSDDNLGIAYAQQWLADALSKAGRHNEAVAQSRAMLDRLRDVPPTSLHRGWLLIPIARVLYRAGLSDEAADQYGEAAAVFEDNFGERSSFSESMRYLQVQELLRAGRASEALPIALEKLERSLAEPDLPVRYLVVSKVQVARCLMANGEHARAAAMWDEVIAPATDIQGDDDRYRIPNLLASAECHYRSSNHALAIERATAAFDLATSQHDQNHPQARLAAMWASRASRSAGDSEQAAMWSDRARILDPEAEFMPVSWDDPADTVGKQVVCEGTIVATADLSEKTYLNFRKEYRGTLSVEIPSISYEHWPERPASWFKDKKILVRGYVYEVRGNYRILILSPEQLEIIPDP